VDCELRKKTGGLTFGFAGQSITVTYPNLVTVQPGSDNKNCTINVIDDGSSRRIPSTHALGRKPPFFEFESYMHTNQRQKED